MHSLRTLLLSTALLVAASSVSIARAENLPMDHPTAKMVKDYLTAVVNQDWATAGKMLSIPSLEKKLAETVSVIKMAPTMTEEAAMLAKLGVKDLAELEKMSPTAFYAAERAAVHQRMSVDPAVLAKKKETLKINIVGLAGEEGDRIVHAVVRTSQETLKERIQELFLISLQKDEKDEKKWVIVPDMMRPVAEKIDGQP
jgi:hypothetical protein